MQDFLDRSRPIFGEEGLSILGKKTIAFAGLGGVGGGAFLALVRCGVGCFRLAENGIFDPPDMNRQAAAFGSTMGRAKLDVYVDLARSINPDICIDTHPEGLQPDNIDHFLSGADAYVGVIDAEKGQEVKNMTPALLAKYGIPAFTCGVIGFGALMVNHAPNGMTGNEFWRLAQKDDTDTLIPSILREHFSQTVLARMKQGMANGIQASTGIGGLASNVLLANEVLAFLLAGVGLVDREPVFAPRYVAVDFLTLQMTVADITK